MALKSRSLILAIIPILVASVSLQVSASLVGGWRQIKNVQDPHVLEIARFALEEHNKQGGSQLLLVKVIKGETQTVAGTNYRLVIAAKDGGAAASKNYEAVVWEKPWEKFRQLTSFVQIS